VSDRQTAPYGRWASEITSESLVQSNIPFVDVFVDPLRSDLLPPTHHIERRAANNGCYGIVTFPPERPHRHARIRRCSCDSVIYVSDFTDDRVYEIRERGPRNLSKGRAIMEPY
ncbi:hypothetical protein EDD16DRAFT_1618532, partial [Pisolithus croceorrhizus]